MRQLKTSFTCYININYLEFESNEKYDLITMIMCDFTALSPQQRKIMLRKFNSLLKPNGSILLDVYSITAFNQKTEDSFYQLKSFVSLLILSMNDSVVIFPMSP